MSAQFRAASVCCLFTAAGCADAQSPPASAAPPPAVSVTIVNRTATTVTGQPLGAPPAPFEVVVSRTEIPAGGVLPMHKHPWPRYAFVESGQLEVRYEESGLVREFGPGDAVVEAIDQWHEGRVVGGEPVRLVVLDQLPPGQTNVVRR